MNGAWKSSHEYDDGKCALSSVDSLKTSYKRNKSNVNFMHGALMSSVTRWGREEKRAIFHCWEKRMYICSKRVST